jgi:hypothetical protein
MEPRCMKPSNRRGRPKLAKDAKKMMAATRLRPKTRAMLQREAKRRGWTLSEEIEDRLEKSFDVPRREMWGDDSIRRFAILMAGAAYWTQRHSKASWHDDPWTFRGVVASVNFLLPLLAPKGEVRPPPHIAAVLEALEDAPGQLRESIADPEQAGRRAALQVAAYMHGEDKDIEGLFIEDVRRASRNLGIEPNPDIIPQMIAALQKESKR